MIKCPLCEGKSRKYWSDRLYKVYRCDSCLLSFISPVPADQESIYGKEYFTRWYIERYSARKAYTRRIISPILKNVREGGRLLDVGCGIGILLEVAGEAGFEAYGQDTSGFAVGYALKKGLRAFPGQLDEAGFSPCSFDIVTIFDVIAHLPDPAACLETCSRLLKPGGILAVKTPLHTGRLFAISEALSFTGKGRSLLHLPAQVFHFCPETFMFISGKLGLETVRGFCVREPGFIDSKDFKVSALAMLERLLSGRSSIIIMKKRK